MKRASPTLQALGLALTPTPGPPMAEANEAYHEHDVSARVAIVALARMAARDAVKRQLQAQAIKLSSLSGREVALLAADYLLANRAVLREQATAQYQRLVESGALRAPKSRRKSTL